MAINSDAIVRCKATSGYTIFELKIPDVKGKYNESQQIKMSNAFEVFNKAIQARFGNKKDLTINYNPKGVTAPIMCQLSCKQYATTPNPYQYFSKLYGVDKNVFKTVDQVISDINKA